MALKILQFVQILKGDYKLLAFYFYFNSNFLLFLTLNLRKNILIILLIRNFLSINFFYKYHLITDKKLKTIYHFEIPLFIK